MIRIAARFVGAAYVGEPLYARLAESDGPDVGIHVTSAGRERLVELSVRVDPTNSLGPEHMQIASHPRFGEGPVDLEFDAMRDVVGTLEVGLDVKAAGALFPRCHVSMGGRAVATVLALSRLVGMECPGRYSMLGSFEIEFEPELSREGVTYRVDSVDPRFRMVRLTVRGPGERGVIESFALPRPTRQPGMQEVAQHVSDGEFSGQMALVVGGTRGLGEATAKIIAAGGGYAAITYLSGQEDACRVLDEIAEWGGQGRTLQLDVRHPGPALRGLVATGWQPTDLYYFATPQIFGRMRDVFETSRLHQFISYYVEGIAKICASLRGLSDCPLNVFYPSSVALDENPPGLADYIAAKAAGEAFTRYLDECVDGVSTVVRRLPRIETDQTATLFSLPAENAISAMLPAVREMQGLRFAARNDG